MAEPQTTSSGFTKEEELLLQDFSRNVSTKSNALFYGNAFIISAVPIWLFWRVHQMELLPSLVFFAIVTGLCTYLMAMAYKNTKFSLKHKIANKREDAIVAKAFDQLGEEQKSNTPKMLPRPPQKNINIQAGICGQRKSGRKPGAKVQHAQDAATAASEEHQHPSRNLRSKKIPKEARLEKIRRSACEI
ncbi:translocon-associated protein, gamma subunit [Culex quinquefasciatus]|uniref:Translocon-associated protein subunit gamma n=1 Tax=Culex quinquefasciatus TaxID=7176 RepID=B0XGY8_CULQU|nr:translocon-associated protein, gamma subunit [Culex quinquefasciatus]|eukprot:XP_001868910.1 translocon-associated protein, gamma subunit [Culex quinquefasciatus]